MHQPTLAIIPARYGSTRLPQKPLRQLAGKTVIERVYRQARLAQLIDSVIVATDHEAIYEHVLAFGGKAIMTAKTHQSGTDRCIEVAEKHPDYALFINIQGDEPFIQPAQIDHLATMLTEHSCEIATLAYPIDNLESIMSPHCVKVVRTHNGKALYFSRQAIPYIRDVEEKNWMAQHTFLQHIGIYGFTRDALLSIKELDAEPLEQAEKLEQLRWLSNDLQIQVGITDYKPIGIDTAEDLAIAEAFLRNQK